MASTLFVERQIQENHLPSVALISDSVPVSLLGQYLNFLAIIQSLSNFQCGEPASIFQLNVALMEVT